MRAWVLGSGGALVWPVGSAIKACALRACRNSALPTPEGTAVPSLLFGDAARTASGLAPRPSWVLIAPSRLPPFTATAPYHSFIPLGLLSCFLPWNSNGSDPGFPASAPSPHPSPGLAGFLAPGSCLRSTPRSMDVASTPFGPFSFSSVFILKIAVFPGEPFPGSGPLCLLGQEVCPRKFPFPQGWPFARVLSSLASVLGSLARAMWGSRRGGVEGGGAPAAQVGGDPPSHHRPLPVAGWGLGCPDTVPGLRLPGTGSPGSSRCPLLPRWSLIAVSRPKSAHLPGTPVPQGRAPSGS